jgi:parvulin-like peptidyl-prolyl isomerase
MYGGNFARALATIGAFCWIAFGCASPAKGPVSSDPAGAHTGLAPTPGAPFDPPPGPEPAPPAGPVGMDAAPPLWSDVLARVEGKPIDKRDLADYLCVNDPKLVRVLVDQMAKLQILRNEIKRLRVEVPEDVVTTRMQRIDSEVEQAAKAAGKDVPTFIGERFGISYDVFRQLQTIRERALVARERVVRYWHYLDDLMYARIIVVEEMGEAERIVSQLRAGAEFGDVARRSSIHHTRTEGGEMPPIGRWGVHPELEEVMFKLEPGEISSPVAFQENGRKFWAIFKCIRYRPARKVAYAEVKDEIEKELDRRPVREIELNGWVEAMMKRYEVEILIHPPTSLGIAGRGE